MPEENQQQPEQSIIENSSENQGSITISPHEVRTLLTWIAPDRFYKKRQKKYYINILLLMLCIETILFLFAQYPLMLVVASLSFLAFAYANTPPGHTEYRISTEGLAIGDHFYLWQELYDFYFKKRNEAETLHIRTKALLPGELIILLADKQKEQLKQILLPFLPYREIVKPTYSERAGDWMVKTFPLEKHTPHVPEVASK